MHEIAPDVFQIPLFPRNGINAYLLGDVLVDAGMSGSAKKILAAVEGRTVAAHTLTHAHVDHVGGSAKVVDALKIPMWVSEGDVEAVESGDQVGKGGMLGPVLKFVGSFDGVDVARRLVPGDAVGPGFEVVDAPGHSPGHVAFWRESDRVLIVGDVFLNMNLLTTSVGLHNPPGPATPDPARNKQSQRDLAALAPAIVGFGHGPVMTEDAAAKLAAFVAKG